MRKKILYGLYLLSFVLIFFGGIELYLNYILNNPEECPKSWEATLKKYYKHYDINIIQFEQAMAQYDSTLFYTLKPGEFDFKNREFSTHYKVNSIGVRDDESSLINPKIVMLGDSYGMGWGVEKNETYADLVEQKLNIKVLNAGISSYGTARELRMLDRINTDSMEYLIIQYCNNDAHEIQEYARHDNELIVSSKKEYDSLATGMVARMKYYPFKHTLNLLPLIFNKDKKYPTSYIPNKKKPVNTFKAFIDIIKSSNKIAPHTKIIIFTLGVEQFNNAFLEDVEMTLNKEFGSSLHDRVSFINFSNVLTPEHYFILDSHIKNTAHKMVADSLVRHISKPNTGISEKKWYYDNGNICIKSTYLNKIKHGSTIYYWPNGKISRQSYFKNGIKHGYESDYDSLGNISSKVNFELGIMKLQTHYLYSTPNQ